MVTENTTQIYNGVCKSVDGSVATVVFNGQSYDKVKFYGTTPKPNENYRVFVPNGNISNAFFIVGGGGSDTPTATDYNSLINLPQINNVTLSGNKTLTDLGIQNDKTYVHNQNSASATWTIKHNLNKYPAVSVADSAGSVVVGDISYIDANTLTLTFTSAFSGKAYCN